MAQHGSIEPTSTVAREKMLEAQLFIYVLLGFGLSKAVGWWVIVTFVAVMCLGDWVISEFKRWADRGGEERG